MQPLHLSKVLVDHWLVKVGRTALVKQVSRALLAFTAQQVLQTLLSALKELSAILH